MNTYALLAVMVIIAIAIGAFSNSQKFFTNLLWSLIIGIFVSWGYTEIKSYIAKNSKDNSSYQLQPSSVSTVDNTMDALFILTASSNMERCGSRSGNVGKTVHCDNSITTKMNTDRFNTQNSRDRPYDTS